MYKILVLYLTTENKQLVRTEYKLLLNQKWQKEYKRTAHLIRQPGETQQSHV